MSAAIEHRIQNKLVREFATHRPVLNVACKDDPANLGEDFDAINVDINPDDIHLKINLKEKVKNFVEGDALNLPFEDGKFRCVVMGEFLEHCPYGAALKALQEAKRVTSEGAIIILTFPLDSRPPEFQHKPEELRTFAHGITSWHQTVWTKKLQDQLFNDAGLVVARRQEISYGIPTEGGYAVVLSKRVSPTHTSKEAEQFRKDSELVRQRLISERKDRDQ